MVIKNHHFIELSLDLKIYGYILLSETWFDIDFFYLVRIVGYLYSDPNRSK